MPRARAHADVVPIRPTTPALPDTAVADGYHPAIPLSEIDPNPANVRRELGDLTELVESIRAVGVRHPVTVHPVSHVGDGLPRWVLVDGHRRYEAAFQADLTTIPAIVRTDITSAADVITEMLRAGLLQERLSPIEEATAYLQLELLGLSAGDIAKRVGRSRSTVEARLHLMDLPEQVRERVHTRSITLDEAAVIAEFTELADRWPAAKNWARTLEAVAGTREWQYTVARARSFRDGEQKRQAARDRVASIGVLLVNDRDVTEAWTKHVQASWYTAADLANAGSDHGDPSTSAIPPEALAHAQCPHAAAIVTVGGYITWLCLRPSQHTRDRAAAAEDVRDEPLGGTIAVPYASEDPWAARDELAKDWREHVRDPQAQAAAAARQAWIRDVLLPGRKAFTAAQTAAVARYTGRQLVRYLIELDGDKWLTWAASATSPEDIAALSDTEVEEELTRRLDGDPMRTLLAGFASQAEGFLIADVSHADRDWLALLQALGYQPCSWEERAAAPVTGICRTCLCTADAACEDGLSPCWWVVPGVDLCSKCARAEVAAATTDG